MNGFYDNTGYVNKRNRKQVLILDVDDSDAGDTHLGTGGEFNIPLFEPLIIDSLSEVYLDNLITFNSNISNITANSAYVLKINEFNINSNVASSTDNNTIFNSIVIPNDHSSVAANHGVVLHKAKKFNYVCDVNPGKISNISGKITNLAGNPIFHGQGASDIFTYTLLGLKSNQLDKKIPNGTVFTGIGNNLSSATTTSIGGSFLADHQKSATAIHFSTDADIGTLDETDGGGSITFTGASIGTITIVNTSSGDAPNIQLIQNAGRFIAEFSINSRE
jgi:hypothetical protein